LPGDPGPLGPIGEKVSVKLKLPTVFLRQYFDAKPVPVAICYTILSFGQILWQFKLFKRLGTNCLLFEYI